MATPAAGKTRFALRVAHEYVRTRRAQRLLVVCPTNHLRTQWADAVGTVGLHLDPALTNEQTREAPDYHGAVVTYQQVALAPQVFQRAWAERTTLVVLGTASCGRRPALGQGIASGIRLGGLSPRVVRHAVPLRQSSHSLCPIQTGRESGVLRIRLYGRDQGRGVPSNSLPGTKESSAGSRRGASTGRRLKWPHFRAPPRRLKNGPAPGELARSRNYGRAQTVDATPEAGAAGCGGSHRQHGSRPRAMDRCASGKMDRNESSLRGLG